jgi:hypothetical protein
MNERMSRGDRNEQFGTMRLQEFETIEVCTRRSGASRNTIPQLCYKAERFISGAVYENYPAVILV